MRVINMVNSYITVQSYMDLYVLEYLHFEDALYKEQEKIIIDNQLKHRILIPAEKEITENYNYVSKFHRNICPYKHIPWLLSGPWEGLAQMKGSET